MFRFCVGFYSVIFGVFSWWETPDAVDLKRAMYGVLYNSRALPLVVERRDILEVTQRLRIPYANPII